MWWIIAVLGAALLLFLLISVLPQHPKRRSRMHDFERTEITEHLYRY